MEASEIARAVAVGLGATLVMDVCAILLHRAFGVPLPNMCLVGRWIRHMPEGVFAHGSIATAPARPAECIVGWMAHYVIGAIFALALVLVVSPAWLRQPTLLPALVFGVATVAGSRDDAGDAFSRAPRDHDGSAASPTPDAATTGPAGAVSAPRDRPIADASQDRLRPEAPREVVEQITTRLRDVSSPGRHELSVRLDPPELGAVQIDARLDGSRLHLVIR